MATDRSGRPEPDFPARRQNATAESLAAATITWLAALPVDVRPRLLPVQFPRIANKLCRHWPSQAACLSYFDEVLIDRRGNRRGFPVGVVLELATLKNHFQSVVHPSPQTVWDEVARRMHD
jgi:hypothetical protein